MTRSFGLPACMLTASLFLIAGCTSPTPKLYTLASVSSGTATQSTGAAPATSQKQTVVVLQQIGLARYLDRQQIVRSSENYQLDVAQNDWWGESLPTMLNRVLVEGLGQRLPNSVVLSENDAVTATADVTVELNISRLDLDASGNLLLNAQANVVAKNTDKASLHAFHLSVRPSTPDVRGEVAAISTALGQLADQLAPVIQDASAGR
ncbi:MAG TPA: PqiC family protein [Terriglobales bacterium]|nr:PqiC family protein [Terriglobales bacterium]